MHKRIIIILLILMVFFLVFYFFALPPLLIQLAETGIRAAGGADLGVRIERLTLPRPGLVRLYNVSLSHPSGLDAGSGEIHIDYGVSLFGGDIGKVTVKKGRVGVAMDKQLPDLRPAEKAAVLPLAVETLEIDDLFFTVSLSGLTAEGEVSAFFDIRNNLIDVLDADLRYIEKGALYAGGMTIQKAAGENAGRLRVKDIRFGNIAASDISAKMNADARFLKLSGLGGRLLDGNIKGDARLDLGVGKKETSYTIRLTFADVSLRELIKALDIEKKMTMTGDIKGNLTIAGTAGKIEKLKGSFTTTSNRGTMIIKDKQILRRMAAKAEQNMDLIMESMTDYTYTTGNMNVSLEEENDINVEISLQGERGKREFFITLHDYIGG